MLLNKDKCNVKYVKKLNNVYLLDNNTLVIHLPCLVGIRTFT